MRRWLSMMLLCWCFSAAAGSADFAGNIADLIAPEKLATLGRRGANQRVQKAIAQLEASRMNGLKVQKVAADAVTIAGYRSAAGKLTREALVRNHGIAARLGCLDAAGLAEMRQGKSPTVRRGPCKGQELSVDHIVPRAVVPELDNVIANLELLPLRINEKKNDTVGDRQLSHAKKLRRAGLLSAEGLKKVQSAGRKGSALFGSGLDTPTLLRNACEELLVPQSLASDRSRANAIARDTSRKGSLALCRQPSSGCLRLPISSAPIHNSNEPAKCVMLPACSRTTSWEGTPPTSLQETLNRCGCDHGALSRERVKHHSAGSGSPQQGIPRKA